MRDDILASIKEAMKSGDKLRVETLRMVMAALKNRDIEARAAGKTLTGDEELGVLQRLIKSRHEAAELYDRGGRPELATKERAEVDIITHFLPRQMSEAEVGAAIAGTIAEIGAKDIKDMGKVIAGLKTKFAGRMDFAKVGGQVKAALTKT